MKIKGLAKTKTLVEKMIDIISDKIDDIDWDKSNADEKDERFNDALEHLESIMEGIEGLEEL